MTDTDNKAIDENVSKSENVCDKVNQQPNIQQNNDNSEANIQTLTNDKVKISDGNLTNKNSFDNQTNNEVFVQENDLQHDSNANKNDQNIVHRTSNDKNNQDLCENNSELKEQQEEDVPESFFDDLMSEDFIEGLNVVDTWEGDEVAKQNIIPGDTYKNAKSSRRSSSSHNERKRRNRSRRSSSKDRNQKDGQKNNKRRRDREHRSRNFSRSSSREVKQNIIPDNTDKNAKSSHRSSSIHKERRHRDRTQRSGSKDINQKDKQQNDKHGKDREHRSQNFSRSSSRDREQRNKSIEINRRRDPTKTQRDILRDKDKCEKDKTTKTIHEKLKVVETGLVPPGMEMEMEIDLQQNTHQTSKLEEGEIPTEEKSSGEKRHRSSSIEHKRDFKLAKTENVRRSPGKGSVSRRVSSPEYRREFRRIRSRSRSRRRYSPRGARSIERRIAARTGRSPRRTRSRTRSRSLELRSLSRERRHRYMSPLRKTSPLIKRNQNLFKEIDALKARLFENEVLRKLSSPVPRNIEHKLSQPVMPPNIYTNVSNMEIPPNFINNPVHYPTIPNQSFIPLQPVPPPQQTHVELDQQFFIGQPGIESNHYPAPMQQPMQQPPMMHNPLMPSFGQPEVPHNFQTNWQPQPDQMNFFNSSSQHNIGQNSYQPPMNQSMGFMENRMTISQEQQMPFTIQQNIKPIPKPVEKKKAASKHNKEEVFANLFADNKITLSDYLSVSAKSTDNSNPVDIQNKIKVISYCQEALHEINGSAKATGKFILRKSQKPLSKPSSVEGLSPFKKVPVIKFQFTTYSKQADDKPQLAASLNHLMFKLGKKLVFEEIPQTSPTISKSDQKDSRVKVAKEREKVKRTSHISTQTDAVSMSDFGCQVNIDEIPSPTKSILKKQSLAKLTPAQLLAQAERDSSPPPAPRWMSPADVQRNWRNVGNDAFRDYDDVERKRIRTQGISGWSIPPFHPSSFYDR